nr:unnamed protein product [Spirometra erinaceieuropaei]
MDYGVQSAALVVPRLRERFSEGISALRDKFLVDDVEESSPSPIFLVQDDPEFMDFHHQEVVESVPELPSDPTPVPSSENVTVDDLDSLDTNDLFSFVLDNATLDNNPPDIKSTPKDTLASAFRTPVLDFEQPDDDISVPPDFISLLDLAASEDFLKDSLSLEDVSLDLESGISSLQPTSESSGGYNLPYFNSSSESGIEAMPAPQFDICSEEFGNCSDGSDAEEEERFTKRGDGRPGPVTMFLHNEDLARGKPGQRLVLSAEERRLLSRMGHKVPTMFPLSRNDERVIRAVRRKIRNKLSAKASRARRQEYLQTLEMRIHSCHKENERLRSRVGELEKEKRCLLITPAPTEGKLAGRDPRHLVLEEDQRPQHPRYAEADTSAIERLLGWDRRQGSTEGLFYCEVAMVARRQGGEKRRYKDTFMDSLHHLQINSET